MPGPTFHRGEHVELRPLEESDAEFVQRLLNHPEVRQGTGHDSPMTLADERESIETLREEDEWTAFLVTTDGEQIGVAGLSHIQESMGVAEVGYFYDPSAWGEGYATDALECLVAHAFEERRLHKLYGLLYANNDASRRVLEKAGFRKEGHFRDHHFHDGEYRDRLQYGLTVEEWREERDA